MYHLASVCNGSYYFLLQGFTEPTSDKLLPDLLPQDQHVFTLVLDLNETLVYSDWQVYCGFIPCTVIYFIICATLESKNMM